jgi:hypothetical protein
LLAADAVLGAQDGDAVVKATFFAESIATIESAHRRQWLDAKGDSRLRRIIEVSGNNRLDGWKSGADLKDRRNSRTILSA